jgi:hypothetical protein
MVDPSHFNGVLPQRSAELRAEEGKMTSGAKLLDDYAQFRNQLDAELLKTERVVSSHAHVA